MDSYLTYLESRIAQAERKLLIKELERKMARVEHQFSQKFHAFAWDESKHPRKGGKFAPKGGGDGGSAKTSKPETTKNESSNDDDFFKSHAHKLAHALTQMDGESRSKALGISDPLFRDSKKADKWRNDIAKKIHPDVFNHPKAGEAMAKLNELHSQIAPPKKQPKPKAEPKPKKESTSKPKAEKKEVKSNEPTSNTPVKRETIGEADRNAIGKHSNAVLTHVPGADKRTREAREEQAIPISSYKSSHTESSINKSHGPFVSGPDKHENTWSVIRQQKIGSKSHVYKAIPGIHPGATHFVHTPKNISHDVVSTTLKDPYIGGSVGQEKKAKDWADSKGIDYKSESKSAPSK